MYCPKCGDVLTRRNGELTCERGDMGLSQMIPAARLQECFVDRTRAPKDLPFSFGIGGRWWCPGCGVEATECQPGDSHARPADADWWSLFTLLSNSTRIAEFPRTMDERVDYLALPLVLHLGLLRAPAQTRLIDGVAGEEVNVSSELAAERDRR